LCDGWKARQIIRDAHHPSSYYSCPHAYFHREADILNTHIGMPLMKILDLLQGISEDGIPANLKLCAKGTWNERTKVETALFMTTAVLYLKRICHLTHDFADNFF
jgi:hypothetical protein